MGYWIQARRGLSVVQVEIALLILGVIAAGTWLTYYASSLPRKEKRTPLEHEPRFCRSVRTCEIWTAKPHLRGRRRQPNRYGQ
jgi:hypothetical protein